MLFTAKPHQGPQPEHQLGTARRRRRAELSSWNMSSCCAWRTAPLRGPILPPSRLRPALARRVSFLPAGLRTNWGASWQRSFSRPHWLPAIPLLVCSNRSVARGAVPGELLPGCQCPGRQRDIIGAAGVSLTASRCTDRNLDFWITGAGDHLVARAPLAGTERDLPRQLLPLITSNVFNRMIRNILIVPPWSPSSSLCACPHVGATSIYLQLADRLLEVLIATATALPLWFFWGAQDIARGFAS